MPRPRFAALAPERSRAILRAAAGEIAERGIDGASYNRIIERAGVSKGAMYYYFDDQWDLYATVVRDAAERAAAAVGSLGAFDDAASFWDALEDLYARINAFLLSEPEVGGLLKAVIAKPSSAAGEAFAEAMRQVEVAFHDLLEDGVRVGAVRDDLPIDLLTRIAYAVGEAFDRRTLEHWETLTPDQAEAATHELLAMHVRVLAPLPLVEQRERGAPTPRRKT